MWLAAWMHGCLASRYDELYEETVRVITGVDHPLAGRSEVAWAETRPYGWIGLPEGSQLWSELSFELAVAAEPPPKVRIETAGLLPTIAILARCDLLGITSHRPARFFCEAGRTAMLALPYASRGSVGLLSQRDAEQTPIRKAFRECVLAQAECPGSSDWSKRQS
ncbi:hypothetical protein LMG31506_04648 [Cupriavidus yeoncheonensis]|uniref:LysR substrate-binding domain-containing protein n=1 Tax=Cupriavidus yeoncheonensis TaxID=1462994 RepID=A0A916IWJ3_9BURK|nr:hypothetical protein LMG31506_04648 [Cupriavidus yeoncheonensis]